MKKEIKDFLEEMDKLTRDGVFGEKAKINSILREQNDNDFYMTKIFLDWCQEKNQVGKDNVHKIITQLLELYIDCTKKDSEKTIEIVSSFFNGLDEVEHSDLVTPLYQWFISLNNWKDSLPFPLGKHPASPLQLAQNSIVAYQKGVEMVNKILTPLLCLKHLSKSNDFRPKNIFNMSLYKKSREYSEIFEEEYIWIIELIDRDLRNAESHLELRYSIDKEKYIFTIKENEKIRIKKEISAFKFMFDYFPAPGWIIQGYVFSLILFVIIGSKFNQDIANIKNKMSE